MAGVDCDEWSAFPALVSEFHCLQYLIIAQLQRLIASAIPLDLLVEVHERANPIRATEVHRILHRFVSVRANQLGWMDEGQERRERLEEVRIRAPLSSEHKLRLRLTQSKPADQLPQQPDVPQRPAPLRMQKASTRLVRRAREEIKLQLPGEPERRILRDEVAHRVEVRRDAVELQDCGMVNRPALRETTLSTRRPCGFVVESAKAVNSASGDAVTQGDAV